MTTKPRPAGKPRCFIFDLDGTLANIEHRLHHIYPPAGKSKDWDAFHKACSDDTLILPTAIVAKALVNYWDIYLLTGRMGDPRTRQRTVMWLDDHGFRGLYHKLLMRPDGDYREDAVIKKEFLDEIRETHEVTGVFEDRLSVCRMWVENGVHVFNVNQTLLEF